MNEDTIQRLLYYKGQLLTAQDFEDQQNYHRRKLDQLTERFPFGIVRGLTVIISPKDANNPNDFEAFMIEEGLAIDADGNAIVVPKQGLRVPVDKFEIDRPYLSLNYSENKSRRSQSPLEDSTRYDRIKEEVEVTWEKTPNISDKGEARITVAKIRLKTNADNKPSEKVGSKHVIEDKAQAGQPTIRLDAGLIGEAQLDEIVKNKLVTNGNSHDHAGSDGGLIPLAGLEQEVTSGLITAAEKIDLAKINSHTHVAGNGGLIPLAGLEQEVKSGLITAAEKTDLAKINSHTHVAGSGGLIPLAGLEQTVKNGLITAAEKTDLAKINSHTHVAGDGGLIPLAGLDLNVQKMLVTVNSFPTSGTFSTPTVNPIIPPFNDNKFRIPNVIPITKNVKLSWSFEIESLAAGIKYHFTIKKAPGSVDPIEYRIDFAEFGG